MHPLVHYWMVKMMICLGPGVFVNGVEAEDGLYNGFCRMDCVWRRQKVADTAESWTCRRFLLGFRCNQIEQFHDISGH